MHLEELAAEETMLKLRSALALFSGLVLLTSPFASAQPSRPAGADVIKFGASLALTRGLASKGRLVKDGYDWMVKEINEHGWITVVGKK